ncbi:pyridine nucleotide-disulfide oxidoreductase [Aliidiomarina minuta]|uniref:Pyridine nucleotide-disulfide oxidoreductase n=1 Tax=Aliidiomarina minuta TaxID=880057 RepID=A0A432W1C8_9GAMM|nr:bifunctional TVP38/TMEM64 family protein/FAD-dependent oxidoreductase [Aliidiomarina minuta]RUO23025.1 pyridine nucleotide-disulfide oxidoreductase [Aliidiomarina minuta]
MRITRVLLLLVVAILIGGFFAFDLQHYLALDELQRHQSELTRLRDQYLLQSLVVAFVIYVLVTAFSLPGAAIMTLAMGAIFGFGWGLLLVSFASAMGATLAFLISRFLLRDWVQNKFSRRLHTVDKRFSEDGAFYLLSLRLVPVFPFFLINLVMGLTRIKTWTFYWVSQVGMLAGTAVYVNAGTQLAAIESTADIFSGRLLLSFTLLGTFPLIAKALLSIIKRRRELAKWKKPRSFDRNLIVIGGGSAGLVSAYIGAAVKAKVTLVEGHKLGGDCLNTGCVPSKTLINVARQAKARRQAGMGLPAAETKVNFGELMTHVQQVIKRIEPHDSVERYSALGVDVVLGKATIKSPWEVVINTGEEEKRLTTRNIIVATGGKPAVPDIEGLRELDYVTSDTVWQLTELPPRLLVLGGGPIGCELAQAFSGLGSAVTQLEMGDRLLAREDDDISALVLERFKAEDIDVRLSQRAAKFSQTEQGAEVTVEHLNASGEVTETEVIAFDRVLVATGRKANLEGFGLQELGVKTSSVVDSDEFMQTSIPTIYAAGDVTGPYQFTHTASHQAWYASVNALFSPFKRFKADYRVIPWATFTDPEVATVGLNERLAKEQGVDYEVTRYELDDLDRAIADNKAYGFIKVLTVPGKDKILGVTMAGPGTSELIAEFVLAMKHNLGLKKILGTIHIYPTMNEANKFAAGDWARQHAPQKVLAWVEKFHGWRRS